MSVLREAVDANPGSQLEGWLGAGATLVHMPRSMKIRGRFVAAFRIRQMCFEYPLGEVFFNGVGSQHDGTGPVGINRRTVHYTRIPTNRTSRWQNGEDAA